MLPLHALLIGGLSTGADPLCRVLEWPVLVRCGDYAFGIYLLQNASLFLCQTHLSFLYWFTSLPPARSALLVHPTVLLTLTIIGHHWVEQPAKAWWSALRRKQRRAKEEA